MHRNDAAAVLSRTRVFSGCEPATLAYLADRAEPQTFRKHEVIFAQGDRGEWLYVVVTGSVKLQLSSGTGEVAVLTTLGPLDTFGELALLDGGARSATAEALQDCELLGLARSALVDLLTEQPRVVDALLRSLGQSLRRLTEQMADAVFLDLPGRVAKLLLSLAHAAPASPAPPEGAAPADGAAAAVVELPVTQSELASMVGGTRQSVNRILAGFESRGLVSMQGRTIVLKRPDLLQRRAAT